MLRFENKSVIVTGAGYGIGESIALAFAREGASLILAGRSAEKLEAVAAAIRAMDRKAVAVAVDVGDEAAVERMAGTAMDVYGGIDILVNNAGIEGPTKLVTEIALEEWADTLRTNLTGAFLCSKHCVKHMIPVNKGSIVNISSVAGRIGYPMRTPYAASKWGMIGLSHSMAAELGAFGIRVNTVCPGPVEGERIDRVIAARAAAAGVPLEKAQRQAVSGIPLGRMVTAEEIANATLYFAGDESAGVTGQAITVCGGMRMQ